MPSKQPIKRHPTRPQPVRSLDPALTRKGVFAHPGSLAIGFLAILFFAYVFNVGGLQTWLEALLNGVNTDLRSHNDAVATWFLQALPYIGMGLAAIAAFLITGMLGGSAGNAPGKSSKSKNLRRTTLAEFIKTAAEHSISDRVAREAYSLLAPRYGQKATIALTDPLGKKLRMTPAQIADMQGTLMRYTDRQIKVGGADSDVDTILELLTAVENSTIRTAPKVSSTPKLTVMEKRPATPAPSTPTASRPAAAATFIRPYRPAAKTTEGSRKPPAT